MDENKTTKEATLKEESAPALSHLDYAKNLMQSLNKIIKEGPNSSSEEFNENIKTLDNILVTNKIEKISDAVNKVIDKIKRLRNYEVTREELIKAFSIFRVALTNWINEEERRRLDIEAIRRVGRMMSEHPEALYNVFFKRDE